MSLRGDPGRAFELGALPRCGSALRGAFIEGRSGEGRSIPPRDMFPAEGRGTDDDRMSGLPPREPVSGRDIVAPGRELSREFIPPLFIPRLFEGNDRAPP